jgi:hypothetical protein
VVHVQVSERHRADAGGVVPERGKGIGQRAAVDWPQGCLTCLRPEPGIDEQRSAVTFDEQAADGHGDLPLLVERAGMAGPVPGGQVREERFGEQPHRPVDCIGELYIIQVHPSDC